VFDLFSGAKAEIDPGLIQQLINPLELSQTKSFCVPARSRKQQMAAGAGLAAKRGDDLETWKRQRQQRHEEQPPK
jgi:hypothetical protein